MIEKLTLGQSARLQEFAERWTRIALCTDPADRPMAERAIRLSYAAAGLPPPPRIVWCGSPLSQGLTRAIVVGMRVAPRGVGASVCGASVWASVGGVWASVGASVRANVVASVRASVGAATVPLVEASVGANVVASVRAASVGSAAAAGVEASVEASIGASIGARVETSVMESVEEASVGNSVEDSVYGQHDAERLGFYAFFREICGLENQTEKLIGLTLLARNAGWALPHQNICWVSERHCILERDECGRIHRVGGPAIAYPDGWAIYAVHGVRIPEEWGNQPAADWQSAWLLSERNAERQRILLQVVGYQRVMQDLGATEIHAEHDMRLVRVARDVDVEPIVLLTVTCPSTGQQYCLRVPPHVTRCEQARLATLFSDHLIAPGPRP